MGKGTNFIGQPLLPQLLKFFDKDKILGVWLNLQDKFE